jgi:hypothetical protein
MDQALVADRADQSLDVSVLPVRSKIARTRADFERFSDVSEYRETGWWRTQSAADCSPRENSLINGKIQGIFAISAAFGSNLDQMSRVFYGVFVEIPYSTEQGIVVSEQGIILM